MTEQEKQDAEFDAYRKQVSPPPHAVLQALQYDFSQVMGAGPGVVTNTFANQISINDTMQIVKITMGAVCYDGATGLGRQLCGMRLFITPQAPDVPLVTTPVKFQNVVAGTIVENELTFNADSQGLNLDFPESGGIFLIARPQIYSIRFEIICPTAFAAGDVVFANAQIWLR